MKEITKQMIDYYKINDLGYDFMGYSLQKNDIYTYHHMIVPARFGGQITFDNGAILCGKSSHPYLHTIESVDYDMFWYITERMEQMNLDGRLDINELRKIHRVLETFERENYGKTTRKGKVLIKDIYLRRTKL